MAKIDPTEITPAMRKMLRGRVLIRVTPWGTIASKWPKKKPKRRTPYEFYVQTEFGRAAQQASAAISEQVIAAQLLAKGSGNVPRDFLTAAAMGVAMQITLADGTRIIPWRKVDPNPQLILDLVTDVVGSVIWRSSEGWVGLGPGNSGQILAVIDNEPQWRDLPAVPGGGGWQLVTSWAHSSNVASVDFSVSGYNEYLVIARNIGATSSGFRYIQLGTGSGPTWHTGATNYKLFNVNGTETDAQFLSTHTTGSTSQRSVIAHILAASLSGEKHLSYNAAGEVRSLNVTDDPITGIRVGTTVGNMNSGAVRILGR